MAIKRVWLDESNDECIACGVCEGLCPKVFEVTEKMAVKQGVDYSLYESDIKDAANECPTSVIKFE